ncbi:MAG: carbohydrate kinase [Desulfobacterales bacterium]|nr:MAG: carbohydrate kinase [Desulfobacterales bacterium]
MSCMLAVDCGLTVCKAVIFSLDGRVIGAGTSKPPVLFPQPGWAERDPENLWQHACRAIKEALADSQLQAEDIACVCVTGQGNGIYGLDAKCRPVRNCILSTDTRALGTVETLKTEGTFEKAHFLTGNQIWAASPPVLMRWIKDHEPEVYARTRHICFVKDYIKYRLTGELNSDHTDVTGGALADTRQIAYRPEILAAYGISEIESTLPPLLNAWDIGGRITRTAAAAAGLAEGTPVAVGGMDLHMTALGCGCLAADQLSIIIGTWAINSLILQEPVFDPAVLFTTTYCIPHRWLLVDGSASSAANLDWFVEQFCAEEKQQAATLGISTFDVINAALADTDPTSSEILFHPFIYGSNVQPTARAGFYGLAGWHRRSDLLRAILEGVCFSHLSHVENLRARRAEREAFLAGGGKRSRIWVQMFCDVLATPITIPAADELGALGCAITAAVAAGHYPDHPTAVARMCAVADKIQPNAEANRVYLQKYRLYKMLRDAMRPAWDAMYHTFQSVKVESV